MGRGAALCHISLGSCGCWLGVGCVGELQSLPLLSVEQIAAHVKIQLLAEVTRILYPAFIQYYYESSSLVFDLHG